MRYFILFLLVFSCNKSQVVEDSPAAEKIQTTIAGYFILEDDLLVSNLDGIQTLSSENLTVGFDFDNAILFFESDELNFPDWRYHKIAMDGFETHGKYSVQEYTDQYSEVQLEDDLNFWINENLDAPIFFHLNLDL